jgi:hypothetical protein
MYEPYQSVLAEGVDVERMRILDVEHEIPRAHEGLLAVRALQLNNLASTLALPVL